MIWFLWLVVRIAHNWTNNVDGALALAAPLGIVDILSA